MNTINIESLKKTIANHEGTMKELVNLISNEIGGSKTLAKKVIKSLTISKLKDEDIKALIIEKLTADYVVTNYREFKSGSINIWVQTKEQVDRLNYSNARALNK